MRGSAAIMGMLVGALLVQASAKACKCPPPPSVRVRKGDILLFVAL
jgi:hypothetical protein